MTLCFNALGSKMLLLVPLLFHLAQCVPDGLHPTPPMGFSSWNTFFAENNEEKMIGIANSIKRLGLDKLGYVYLTVDDYWNLPERDQNGDMQVNRDRFPNGMKFLSDHFHSLGLKFGIYSDAGTNTCGGMAGSLGFEERDVQLFLKYEIDYLKYDNCYPMGNVTNWASHLVDIPTSLAHLPSVYQIPPEQARFEAMAKEVQKVKHIRNITLELCLYGWGGVEQWGPAAGHLWRTGDDARDEWFSVLYQLDRNDEPRFLGRQGPTYGAWNYPDALVGRGGMTNTEYKYSIYEYRTLFSLWCIIKAPLMLGNDLRNMTVSDEAYKIIANKELIDVNQDSLGVQATCVKDCCARTKMGALFDDVTCQHFNSSWQVWQGPLSGNALVAVIINRYDEAINTQLDWERDARIPSGEYDVRDLWGHRDIGRISVGSGEDERTVKNGNTWPVKLEAHGSLAVKLTPVAADISDLFVDLIL